MAKKAKGERSLPLPLFPDKRTQEELQRLLDEARKLVSYQVADFSAELLGGKFKATAEAEGDIFVPEYQRTLVWSDQRQSYFIESLLLRVPVPPLFLYDVKGRLEIIDGSQRLRTIHRFMSDELRLTDMEKLDFLNGFAFSDLPPSTQLRFKNTPIRTFVLTEDTDGVTRFDIFRRLNTSGKPLTDAQIRVGAFPGPLLTLVRELAVQTEFAKLCPIGKGAADPASERQELVLRFFAYSDTYKKFTHDVRAFLDRYLIDRNHTDLVTLDTKRKDFHAMIKFVQQKFPYGFQRTRNAKITPRVRFEAISVGVHLALKSGKPLVTQNFEWLESPTFKDLVRTDASNSGPKLRARVEFVRDALVGQP
jgi:hypothetical protein